MNTDGTDEKPHAKIRILFSPQIARICADDFHSSLRQRRSRLPLSQVACSVEHESLFCYYY